MSDEAKFIMTTIAGMLTGGIIQAWFNRRKTASDAYSVLVEALSKSGEIIGNDADKMKKMIEMLVKLPQLESQLRAAQDRITTLEHQSIFWMSFSRTMHGGAVANAEYIRKLDHVPPFEPPSKFPSKPLGALQA